MLRHSVVHFLRRHFAILAPMSSGVGRHFVFGTPLNDPFIGMERAVFGMGCFWGAERMFWKEPGVVSTAVGYAGGTSQGTPTYEKVCCGTTGHAEVVRVIYDPSKTSYEKLLDAFWANHDPTQVNRQGNDRGTQYRSVIIFFNDPQRQLAETTRASFQQRLATKNLGSIATQIVDATTAPFWFAEDYHQQYLAKNPGGYCGLRGLGCYVPRS